MLWILFEKSFHFSEMAFFPSNAERRLFAEEPGWNLLNLLKINRMAYERSAVVDLTV